MNPIALEKFEEHVRLMHEDRDKGFEQEYQVSSSLSLPPSLLSFSDCILFLLPRPSVLSQQQATRLPRTPETRTKTDLPTSSHVSNNHTMAEIIGCRSEYYDDDDEGKHS